MARDLTKLIPAGLRWFRPESLASIFFYSVWTRFRSEWGGSGRNVVVHTFLLTFCAFYPSDSFRSSSGSTRTRSWAFRLSSGIVFSFSHTPVTVRDSSNPVHHIILPGRMNYGYRITRNPDCDTWQAICEVLILTTFVGVVLDISDLFSPH